MHKQKASQMLVDESNFVFKLSKTWYASFAPETQKRQVKKQKR
jgi:hypothetical protein